MKLAKVLRIIGYSAVKLATVPLLLSPLHKYMDCYDPDVSLWDILSLADFDGCQRSGQACANSIDAGVILGVVFLVFVEIAYLWLLFIELRKPPPIEKRHIHESAGVHVEWVDTNYSATSWPDLEFTL
ncbi:uncharacterized protein LOC111129154 [Crassostrea virginica]